MPQQELPPPGAPDIDIARAATMEPILPLAEERIGVPAEALFRLVITRRNSPSITLKG